MCICVCVCVEQAVEGTHLPRYYCQSIIQENASCTPQGRVHYALTRGSVLVAEPPRVIVCLRLRVYLCTCLLASRLSSARSLYCPCSPVTFQYFCLFIAAVCQKSYSAPSPCKHFFLLLLLTSLMATMHDEHYFRELLLNEMCVRVCMCVCG